MEQHIPGIVLKDGLTQPVFDYKRCLFEKVYVETPVDTDGDGRPVQGIGVSGTWSGGLECQADTLRQSLCRHGIQRDPL